MDHHRTTSAVATPSPPNRPTLVRWQIVGLLMAFSFMTHFNRVSLPVAADRQIMDEFSISPTAMGSVYSAFLFTYTLLMIPGGWLGDRFGARLVLTGMGLGSAACVALTALPSVGWLPTGFALTTFVGVRALMGMCTAPVYPACGRVVGAWISPDRRSVALGMVTGAAFLGIACTYPVFGSLVGWLRWPTAFLVNATVTAAIGLLWWRFATNSPQQHPKVNIAERHLFSGDVADSHQRGEGDASRYRCLLLLTLCYGSVGYFEDIFAYWMHFYFSKILELGTSASATFAAIPYLAMAATMPLGGWLSDRLTRQYGARVGRTALVVTGMMASAAFLGLGVVSVEPAWVVVWFTLALGSIGACEGPLWATVVELGRDRASTFGGIFNTGGNVGSMISPALTPWLAAQFGWGWAIGVGGMVCLTGVVTWVWIDPRSSGRN